jgi:putative tryptophan/tyrosine transport system substrate-binding protein
MNARRKFITLIGGAAAWPLVARAQQGARELPKIGVIFGSRSENNAAFLEGLREAGYVHGQNVLVYERLHGAAVESADNFAREFVDLKCRVIMAGTPYAIRAAMKATSTIPIVGVDLESDPVASGIVKTIARPGGNFTGFFLDIPELGGKQIELLMETVRPISHRGGVGRNNRGSSVSRRRNGSPAPGVILQSLPIRRAEDFGPALVRALRQQAQGMIVLSSPLIFVQRGHIANLALNARMPTISLFTAFPVVGGLMAYGPNFPSLYHQAGGYVARVLAGANPGELPIQRPSKFELVLNLKTARAIGVNVADAMLARADQVIE